MVPLNGTLPASILGDMWGRFWSGLYSHMVPYPDRPNIQPGVETMAAANMTVEEIVSTTEDFYVGLGFEPMVDTFRNYSMFRRPSDGRTVNCHATAWDFSNGKVGMERDLRRAKTFFSRAFYLLCTLSLLDSFSISGESETRENRGNRGCWKFREFFSAPQLLTAK